MEEPNTTPATVDISLTRGPSRVSVIRTCSAQQRDGRPCSSAALKGHDRCRHHVVMAERPNREEALSKVSIPTLRDLATLDVTTDDGIARFRRGLMAHVVSHTLDPGEAKAAHELAVAMYIGARTAKATIGGGMDALATQLAKAFAADPQNAPAPGS